MGGKGLGTCVCDAGALIAIERGTEQARAFLRRRVGPIVIPATVLAQVWRGHGRQARLATFIGAKDTTIESLDELDAKAVGSILGRTATSDVVDASVVLAARKYAAVVITSDASDLRRIDPRLEIEEI